MCPDRKIEWFKSRKFGPDNRDCTAADIKRLKGIVINVWKKKYAVTSAEEETGAAKAKAQKGKKAVVMYFLSI